MSSETPDNPFSLIVRQVLMAIQDNNKARIYCSNFSDCVQSGVTISQKECVAFKVRRNGTGLAVLSVFKITPQLRNGILAQMNQQKQKEQKRKRTKPKCSKQSTQAAVTSTSVVHFPGTSGLKRPRQESDNSNANLLDTDALACILCDDEPATITFHPCNHKVCCQTCSLRMKRCLRCNKNIDRKTKDDGAPLTAPVTVSSSILELPAKLNAQEQVELCPICFDQKKSVFFTCGHLACAGCDESIQTCHSCQPEM